MKCTTYPQRVFKNEDITIIVDLPAVPDVSTEGMVFDGMHISLYTDGKAKKELNFLKYEDGKGIIQLEKGELNGLADGVIKFVINYTVGYDDYTVNSNSNLILVTPEIYSASSIDDVWNDGYDSGYTDATALCPESAETWNNGYASGRTDGYASGVTDGYASGSTEGYASGKTAGYTSGITYQKGLLANTAFTVNGTYTRENGWSSVTISVQGGEEADNSYLYKYANGMYGYNQPCDVWGVTEYGQHCMDYPEQEIELFDTPIHPFPYNSNNIAHVYYEARNYGGMSLIYMAHYNDRSTYGETSYFDVSPGKAMDIPWSQDVMQNENCGNGGRYLNNILRIGLIYDSSFGIGNDENNSVLCQKYLQLGGVYGAYLFPYLNSAGTGTYLPDNAFKGSDITHIDVPTTMTHIGADAFNGSTLRTITFRSTTPPTFGNNYVFSECNNLLWFFVPDTALQAYKTALSSQDLPTRAPWGSCDGETALDRIKTYHITTDNDIYNH